MYIEYFENRTYNKKALSMDDIFTDFRRVMDELTAPLGDYASVARLLLVDYKDGGGRDYHQDLLT